MKLSREEVAVLIRRHGFKKMVVARDTFVFHEDGTASAEEACNDDGPEDSLYFEASIVIHCDLPKGHAEEKHRGHDGEGRPCTWTKNGQWVENIS